MARLGDGDAAYANVLQLFRQSTRHNLFDVCGLKENSPFQIDGNLGGPTGLIEMLLQSHAGVVRLLPALPKAWPDGSFRGLPARTGLELDLTWKQGRPTQATLRAALTQTHTIAPPPGQRIAAITEAGKPLQITQNPNRSIRLRAKAGTAYNLTFS
jgi:alpha-L-fucosidase 2